MAPAPVFLPGESHGQRSLAGCRPWGRKESDLTERLTLLTFKSREGNHREDIKGAGVIPPREERAEKGHNNSPKHVKGCFQEERDQLSSLVNEDRTGSNGT